MGPPLGVGATADDLAFLRTAGTDHYGGPSGISLFVAGNATKDGQKLSFAWPFRGRARYRECASVPAGKLTRGFDLTGWDEGTRADAVRQRLVFDSLGLASSEAAVRLDRGGQGLVVHVRRDGKVTVDAG